MERREFLAGTATTLAASATAGCTTEDNTEDTTQSPENEPESNNELELNLTASHMYEEHITYGDTSVEPANPDDGRPIGMIISWEITVDSAPDNAACIETDIAFDAIDDTGNVYWNVADIHGEQYSVGNSDTEEYYIPVPTEQLDDPEALPAPQEIEVFLDLSNRQNCE